MSAVSEKTDGIVNRILNLEMQNLADRFINESNTHNIVANQKTCQQSASQITIVVCCLTSYEIKKNIENKKVLKLRNLIPI